MGGMSEYLFATKIVDALVLLNFRRVIKFQTLNKTFSKDTIIKMVGISDKESISKEEGVCVCVCLSQNSVTDFARSKQLE